MTCHSSNCFVWGEGDAALLNPDKTKVCVSDNFKVACGVSTRSFHKQDCRGIIQTDGLLFTFLIAHLLAPKARLDNCTPGQLHLLPFCVNYVIPDKSVQSLEEVDLSVFAS